VLTFAAGIDASTAIFSIVNAALIPPLPCADAPAPRCGRCVAAHRVDRVLRAALFSRSRRIEDERPQVRGAIRSRGERAHDEFTRKCADDRKHFSIERNRLPRGSRVAREERALQTARHDRDAIVAGQLLAGAERSDRRPV
jgi:hypothetical protein